MYINIISVFLFFQYAIAIRNSQSSTFYRQFSVRFKRLSRLSLIEKPRVERNVKPDGELLLDNPKIETKAFKSMNDSMSPPISLTSDTSNHIDILAENANAIFKRDITKAFSKSLDTAEDVITHLRRVFSSKYRNINLSKLDTANALLEETDPGGYIRLGNKPRIVVVGSGWSAHAFLKIIDADLYEVICISPRPFFLFTPMLAATALGAIEYRSIIEPIRSSNPLVDYIESEAIEICPYKRTLIASSKFSENNITIEYDHLIHAVGAAVNNFGLQNVTKYCDFIKEIEDVQQIKRKILDSFEKASIPSTSASEINRLLTFCVVGGGPTGIEFIGELHDFVCQEAAQLYPRLLDKVVIKLINAGSSILNAFDSVLQLKALDSLVDKGIQVSLNARVTNIDDQKLKYSISHPATGTGGSGKAYREDIEISYGMVIWAAGTKSRPITVRLGSAVSDGQGEHVAKNGKLQVDKWLRVLGFPIDDSNFGSLLAMGDCAQILDGEDGILPQTAQVAAQQGAYIARLFNRKYNLTMAGQPPQLPSDTWSRNPVQAVSVRGMLKAEPFAFLNLGLLAYIGGDEAVAQVQLGNTDFAKTAGGQAFLLWRSVYLVKQVSTRTRFLVLIDYIKSQIFGRDISGV